MAAVLTRRLFLASGVSAFAAAAGQTEYSFSVFSLLRPQNLIVHPQANARLHYRTAEGSGIIEGRHVISIDNARTPLSVSGANQSDVWFVLEAPGVLRRHYFGRLEVASAGRLLRPVVTMNCEVAVGSIVGAELPAGGTPMHALATQAMAARSFLCAGALRRRHAEAQFCDTTHCQFLRAPAANGSLVEQAVKATNGLVLSTGSRVIPAHYSAACGGRTDSAVLDDYQYRPVICEPCRKAGSVRRGHGLGLCQSGAISLAKAGWHWREIAAKYYPGSEVRSV